MRRTPEIPLIAGMAAGLAIGLGGVALGVLLAYREGEALRQFTQQATRTVVPSRKRSSSAGRRPQDSGPYVRHLAHQARQASEQMAKAASAQYEQYLPKVREALSGALAHAGVNGKSAGSAGTHVGATDAGFNRRHHDSA